MNFNQDDNFDLYSVSTRKPTDAPNTAKRKKIKRIVNIVASIVLTVSVLLTGVMGAGLWALGMDINDETELEEGDFEKLFVSADSKVSYILVLGVDPQETLTDIIIVACIDHEKNTLNFLQIPRDTYIGDDVPTKKVNAVYGNPRQGEARINALRRRLSSYFGIPLDHYVRFTIKGFANCIDSLGGITVNVETKNPSGIDIMNPFTQIHERIGPGVVTLTGPQAVGFVRKRTGVKDGYVKGDIDRIEAQREVYVSLAKKLQAMSTGQMVSVAKNCYSEIATDMSINQILGYAEEVKDHFATIRRYRTAGYLPAEYVDGTPFAVDIRRGCGYSPEKWSREEGTDYTCTVYKRPMAKNGNTLDSIFVVSAQSKNPSRAAEIISLFNTNAELENLLQFGIEGTHYYLNSETGKIRVNPNGGYVMNNNYTGNFYLKYDLDGEENHLEAYKQQNLDSLVSFYYGFVPELTLQDELTLEEANRIALEYYPGLLRGDYDVDATFAQINARLSAIDVSSEISAMLRENPALENERFIYSYDEKKNADDTEEEDPVDETPDDTAAEGDAVEGDAVEGDAVETVDREISAEEGNGAFERTVKSIDDLLYKFTSTPGGSAIFSLQQGVTSKYMKKENGNA